MNFSLENKKWTVKECDEHFIEAFSKEISLSKLLTKLLVLRGIDSKEKYMQFCKNDISDFYDPYLLKDMDKAVDRIRTAIKSSEKIIIYGDYDVDGVTSVSVLYLFLKSMGADVSYYIPERIGEGYGVNIEAIDMFLEKGINLMITVDTGITADDEVKYAKEHGIDVVVTDHHECRQSIPKYACAVVNPKRQDDTYPFKELAGVGVVFKLICAVAGKEKTEEICKEYIDYVCVGTVADVMSLTDENRLIVSLGIRNLANTQIKGFRSLLLKSCCDSYGNLRKINSSLIGYTIAPRINAAGRIGQVSMAVDLLITDNDESADDAAQQLCEINRERQSIENDILLEAEAQLAQKFDLSKDKAIVLASDNWHQGVIGIVASKITEKYRLPCILIAFDNDIGKGSGRSVHGFNINDALAHTSDILLKYGGHELAVGLSVTKENYPAFVKSFCEYAKDNLTYEMTLLQTNIDCELSINDMTIENAEAISKLEPFGTGNPQPVFMTCDLTIKNIISIGQNKHTKMILTDGKSSICALFFGRSVDDIGCRPGDVADFVYTLDINDFRGERTPQMIIKDMRMCKSCRDELKAQEEMYLSTISLKKVFEASVPDMNAFKSIFIYLRRMIKGKAYINVYDFSKSIDEEFSQHFSPSMVNVALDVFADVGLIILDRESVWDVYITLNDIKEKVNLYNSELIKKIKEKLS